MLKHLVYIINPVTLLAACDTHFAPFLRVPQRQRGLGLLVSLVRRRRARTRLTGERCSSFSIAFDRVLCECHVYIHVYNCSNVIEQ